MQNFEIKFGLEVKVGHRQYREGGLFGRIISAQSPGVAQKIARAMLGEEVFSEQYLSEVLSVEPTEKEPRISSFCPKHYTWERVLQKLGFAGTGEVVNFCSYQADKKRIVSGILFNPDQIQRVLSSVLGI